METIWGRPLGDYWLERVRLFLQGFGLSWDKGAEVTLLLIEDNEIIATGSRQENVLKCIAVSKSREGEGHIATVVTELIKDALLSGYSHLMLFTKPSYTEIFGALGFYTITVTSEVALLENMRKGISLFVGGLSCPVREGVTGSVVANCNPFTNGHLYLIEAAAGQCDVLHLFVLSEDKSAFSSETRIRLVTEGVKHLPNVFVHPTGPYMISNATFPSYFLKDSQDADLAHCRLDLAVFAEHFAIPMGITKRFVGSEPYCGTTNFYNRTMSEFLPEKGIEVVELPRLEIGGEPVSASRVRRLLQLGKLNEIKPLVPETTYAYLAERGTDLCKTRL